MPNSNLADLISCVPGDYAFHKDSYERAEGFSFDLDVTRQFCADRGFFFNAVSEPGTQDSEAFFVNIRR